MKGDRENPLYQGYICAKGTGSPAAHYSDDRLLHSMKRMPDGSFQPIPIEHAMDEIADILGGYIRDHGPRAIASYFGTGMVSSTTMVPAGLAFMNAIKSPMKFSPESIDQAGKTIAKGLHGVWMAPGNGWMEPDAILLVGSNPLISVTGFPYGNPNLWLRRQLARGMKLIVIDPRRTDVAERALIHLQPLPGHDAAILAAMAKVIMEETLYDHDFVAENASGLDEFRRVISAISPHEVAAAAGIDADMLVMATRIFAGARRGYAVCGTGPSMAGSTTLIEYLRMNLETLCGHWSRAGDPLPNAGVTISRIEAKAQATPPFPSHGEAFGGERMRVRGLSAMLAGCGSLPTAALADEILMPGEGQVRALLSCAGNPVLAWPDQLRTIEAFKQIGLLVSLDIKMSATARMSHYVIAPRMHLETPGITSISDGLSMYGTGIGLDRSYGQYTPALVEPPQGSDLIEEWEFFYGLAKRLGVRLEIPRLGGGIYIFDMARKPSSDEVIAEFMQRSRIPLDELKQHPHGALFPDKTIVVGPKEPGWVGRLDLANPEMMRDLEQVAASVRAGGTQDDPSFPFKLISRRARHVYNSIMHGSANRGKPYNPAFMNPVDMGVLGITAGEIVEIRSRHGAIPGVVESDETLRRGVVSMSHCFGGAPEADGDVRTIGSPTSRLVDVEDDFERYSGQPRMSGVPVQVLRTDSPSGIVQPLRSFSAASFSARMPPG
jgi:anaerobic selenocysteine-containing dehydrogenase